MAPDLEADPKARLLHKKEGDCIVDIKGEKLNQDTWNSHILSRLNSALVKTNPDAYKPKLISIGPYHMKDHGLKKSTVKQDFLQKSVFMEKQGLKKILWDLKDKARSYYDQLDKMNDDQFVEMLRLDGCFILEFLEQRSIGQGNAFMKVEGNVFQILSDMLLFENQLPFFILFQLFKLKNENQNDDNVLLQDLILLVNKCYATQLPKLTPLNVTTTHQYTPQNLPNYLLQVVHTLCMPRNAKSGRRRDDSGGIIEQINTATELENDGVGFQKIGSVYENYYDEKGQPNFNAEDGTTLFDIDFINGTLKIPSFKIDDYTEAFLRNMIAYEQQSADAHTYFIDFACFMDDLINSDYDVKLLRRSGIIVNWLATDKMVTKIFSKLCDGVITYSTFSGVIKKVNRHGEKAWNIWIGKLRQDLFYSPWKLISTVVGSLFVTLGTAVSIKNLLR